MPASDPPLTPFPVSPLAQRLFALAAAAGHEARIVGGAVRDWQAGFDIGDIDMAVAAPIEAFASRCRDAGLRVIETGLSHGTVTVAVDGDAIEVTQTRVDLETDGRHALVGFSDDWQADARRRDFTINALYLDADGRVDDPLGGLADLRNGMLRFAGDAAQRVEEDALRMLRYCRFLPRFGGGSTDADALVAIAGAPMPRPPCQASVLPPSAANCSACRRPALASEFCTAPASIRVPSAAHRPVAAGPA